MQVVLASGNAHKAEEISAALPAGIELILQSDLGIDSVEETGLTFIENALIKARNAAACSGLPALADDCLLYTSPSPRDRQKSRMPSSA